MEKQANMLRSDTTREFFFKRKLINYTKNDLQGINILKLRLPKGSFTIVNIYVFVQSVRRREGGTMPAYYF